MRTLFLVAVVIILWLAMSGRLVAAINVLAGTPAPAPGPAGL